MSESISIRLRKVQFSDAPLLMDWENRPENYLFTTEKKQYSFQDILDLIASSLLLNETGQERWMIESEKGEVLGAIDYFEYSKMNQSIQIGILIAEEKNRRKGYAEIALRQSIAQLSRQNIVRFSCEIHADNFSSIALFTKCGFQLDESSKNSPTFGSNKHELLTFFLCAKK